VKRFALAAAALALAVPATGAATPSAPAKPAAPVIKLKDRTFGNILATRGHKALYYWNVEKRAGGKIRCTGACAVAWPPLLVRSRAAVPRRIAGIKGTFGTIRRPNGRLQVTHNKLPVYTYAHEGPNQVLCDDVDGWFVVRL
jgi:predicted lipoprotein with Yx(FWY)xxD motif